jgi:hypothetical protein
MDLAVLQRKHTRLEVIAPDEVGAVLEYKTQELQEKGLPIEQGLADYIAFGLQNIDDEIEKLKNYKKAIDEKIKEMQEQKTQVSERVAEWLESNGIDKLKGTYVSSVTIKPESERKSKKFVLDVDKEALVKLGVAHYEEVVTPTPKQVKINKKRKKDEKLLENN